MKAAHKCFDRDTGKHIRIGDLATYRGALAQYHMYPETKFLNGQYPDRGPTQRRHVRIGIGDVHYIGKETNELEEQIFTGLGPEAQPEYGMESGAYAELLIRMMEFVSARRLRDISAATGVSARYLRIIRKGRANVTIDTLKRIEHAVPMLEASRAAELRREKGLLDWAKIESDRIGLRELARQLRTDPATFAKILFGKRPARRSLLHAVEQVWRRRMM